MNARSLVLRLAALAACVFVALAAAGVAAERRPMTVEDLFTIEQLGEIAASPDGEWLAVVVKRARTTREVYKRDYLWENDHADVWLVPRRSGEPRNLTNGVEDRSGWWSPVWSPDGSRIALLSTRGGDNVRLWVWERASGTLRRLTEDGVDLQANASLTGGWPYGSVVWVDATTLMCPVLPAGERPLTFDIEFRAADLAYQGSLKAREGREPTVSVLESGKAVPEAERPTGRLLLLDAVGGTSVDVGRANVRSILVSPDGAFAAVIAETGAVAPRAGRTLRWDTLRRTKLGLLDLGRRSSIRWVTGLFDPALTFGGVAHRWSPDSGRLAVLARRDEGEEKAETAFLVTNASTVAQQVTAADFSVSGLGWTAEGDALVFGHPAKAGGKSDETRNDWYLLDARKPGTPRVALTAGMKEPPPSLMLSPNSRRVLGIAGGDLWAIEVANGKASNLTEDFDPTIEEVIHPTETDLLYRPVGRLVMKTGEKDSQDKEWFEVAVGDDRATTTPFPRPEREADLNLYRPGQGLAVFSAALADGTFVWTRGDESASFSARLSFNEHLAGIAEGERRVFDYRGVEGDALKGFLLLPVGYQEGTKVPLAVFVYAGHMVRGIRESLAAKNSPIYLNLQLLAARGYAVLVPSMPLPPEGQAGDPYIDLPKGVMSAVDKVVEMGVADPGKLVVWGQSYGGYSTYTLVTYTQRFKAAVALAGLSELVSLYGILDARERYDRYPHEFPFAAILSESGQIRMGDTPWGDLWRYLRNSPLYYLDRVQTPLMIVQGDLDYVAIEQGELFFSGLHRLGKRAQFVRYWGDSHTLESPANIRDMWQRIFAWFDEHLSPKAPERSETPS